VVKLADTPSANPPLPFPSKLLITLSKALALCHLQINSTLPAVSTSSRQMQAVGAKSGAVQPPKLTVASDPLPFALSVIHLRLPFGPVQLDGPYRLAALGHHFVFLV
jgi:hypothetical protein